MKRLASLVAAAGAVALSLFVVPAGAATTKSSIAAAPLPTMTITLTGKTITVGGSTVSGAVSVVSTSTVAQAEPTLVWLRPGATFQEAFAAGTSHNGDANYLTPYGSIVFDMGVGKGTTTAQTVLQPGTYVALDTQNNNPKKWPVATFTVTASPAPAALPTPGATVSAIEFGFRGASVLRDGELVRFQNSGFVVHMIVGVRFKNIRTARRAVALLLRHRDTAAQRLADGFASFAGPLSPGGLAPLAPGGLQQETIAARPGVYVLLCYMDTQDGREHTQLGMERIIRIVK